MGCTVYGVEGREDGVRRADAMKAIQGFEKTHFSVGNVDHATSYRKVDGIFNAGVLYHLEDPVACLERCAENARLFVYLDTGHKPRTMLGNVVAPRTQLPNRVLRASLPARETSVVGRYSRGTCERRNSRCTL